MRARLTVAAVSLFLVCGCSSESPTDEGGGATAGSAGSAASGTAGGGAAGSSGSAARGGAPSSGGSATGGSGAGAGGLSGSGAAGAGGRAGAGSGGTNASGGSAGSDSAGASGTAGASTSGGTSSGGVGGSAVGGSGGGAAGPVGCDRAGLTAAVDLYLEGLRTASYEALPLAPSATYTENENSVGFGEGLWEDPLTIDFHRSLLDVTECASFTEIIITNPAHPYVLGARIDVSDGNISSIDVLVTDEGDWLFDADRYLQYSEPEDWSEVPEAERLDRERLHDDAASYFKFWGDRSVEVPWGMPCARLEGGEAYTGTTCDVGIPEDTSFEPMPTDYLADPDHGMVVLYVNFGNPDTHLFRILDSGIRYVHTLTVQ